MATVFRKFRATFFAGALLSLLSPTISYAGTPAFYHYYYVYKSAFDVCGDLVNEVYDNTDKNWHFPKSNVRQHSAVFSVGDVRGSLRCLTKKSNESWVVIVATGNDSGKTRNLYDELKIGVCGGNC